MSRPSSVSFLLVAVLLLAAVLLDAASAQQSSLRGLGGLGAGGQAMLRQRLLAARKALRRPPAVPEPPPETIELCKLRGHMCEKHTVATEDGFLLTVVRIPARPGAVPVFLLHGDLASSDSWMMRNDNSNLGTVLSEAGYDVWLGNSRGSTHGRSHLTLNISDPAFWNWSWHEMGLYDVPGVVNYILNNTGASDLHVMGHSMATSAMLVWLAEKPQDNAKVRLVSLMSPSIALRPGIIRWAFSLASGSIHDAVQGLLVRNSIWEIWPRSDILHYIGDVFCNDDSPLIDVCYAMYEQVLGRGHPDQRLPDYLSTFGAYHPAGTSFRCIEHFGVVNVDGRFRPLGRGVDDPNPPPDYNLTAVSAPVALYYSANDGIIDPKDVDRLGRILPNVYDKHMVPLKQFNHVDFMWAKDVRGLIYERVLRNMKAIDSKVSLGKNDIRRQIKKD